MDFLLEKKNERIVLLPKKHLKVQEAGREPSMC